jgi:excisionase family DNA binding protein
MATRSPKTDILMIKDVAEYLKVTERTIYRLAAAKKIPAFKVGGSWRFSRGGIDEWIRLQAQAGIDAAQESARNVTVLSLDKSLTGKVQNTRNSGTT